MSGATCRGGGGHRSPVARSSTVVSNLSLSSFLCKKLGKSCSTSYFGHVFESNTARPACDSWSSRVLQMIHHHSCTDASALWEFITELSTANS